MTRLGSLGSPVITPPVHLQLRRAAAGARSSWGLWGKPREGLEVSGGGTRDIHTTSPLPEVCRRSLLETGCPNGGGSGVSRSFGAPSSVQKHPDCPIKDPRDGPIKVATTVGSNIRSKTPRMSDRSRPRTVPSKKRGKDPIEDTSAVRSKSLETH